MRLVRPHAAWVFQEAFRNEFLRLVEILLGVVNVPDVNEDWGALGNAVAIINVIPGGGMRHALRGNGAPAVDLLDRSFSLVHKKAFSRNGHTSFQNASIYFKFGISVALGISPRDTSSTSFLARCWISGSFARIINMVENTASDVFTAADTM